MQGPIDFGELQGNGRLVVVVVVFAVGFAVIFLAVVVVVRSEVIFEEILVCVGAVMSGV